MSSCESLRRRAMRAALTYALTARALRHVAGVRSSVRSVGSNSCAGRMCERVSV